jgi:flagellar biosynthesis anti-sigma factor FlgM
MTRINDLQTVFGSLGGTQGADKTGATATAKGTPAASTGNGWDGIAGGQVQLSSAAGALAQAGSDSDVRTDKVAQLKAAIDSGSYKVSSTDVADKLMQSMLNGGK